MNKHIITYEGKDYEVKEPTIEMWTRLGVLKDILDEGEFLIKVISEATGLKDKEIKQADWYDIMTVGTNLTDYLINQTSDFHNEFVFKDVKYRFIDLPNLTFGEFIDIDSFITKPEIERKSQLNMLMALFYREVGEDGKIVKYDGGLVAERAELFKKLPIKYVHGALGFFLLLEKTLLEPSPKFLTRVKWIQMKMKVERMKAKVLRSIGVGLEYLQFWRTRTSPK
jgi:hypothetical protein